MKHIITILLVHSISFASQEIESKIQQLEENQNNAMANYKAYEDNLEIVDENILKISTVISEIQENQKALKKHFENSDKNKVKLIEQKKKLGSFINEEKKKNAVDQDQIVRLQNKIKALKANQLKRSINISVYEEKISEIDTELNGWQQQNQRIADLQKTLSEKEKAAIKEKKSWQAKKKNYESESKNWQKIADQSKKKYFQFNKLSGE